MTLSPKAALELRSRLLHATRSFFHERGFTEVDTPVRIQAPAQETHINAEPSGDRWLRASPELQMKRLLAAGHEKIFQLGPCFRRGERGDRHNPEYTMLEWYRARADYEDILEDTRALFAHVAGEQTSIVYRGQRIDLTGRWERISVRAAFLRWAGWDPAAAWDEDRFNVDLVEKVEPAMPRAVPVVLADYPAPAASLARRKSEDPLVAERWELYIGGLEIANAYSELTDPVEQRRRFEIAADERRAMGKEVYPFDEAFFAELAAMPPSGGIALGVDRLVMLFADASDIGEVLAFRD
ncbi:MAG: EF-P lysine aminoacylase GenX [Kiritimatiellae bacterium]|nr:EF-P lysine aminoacylase GenX [Kiritimatiellia bacterium]MCO5067941.1 EF-P lysine aminoacylase EpmA [Kiritimatiellia bacterium]